MLSELQLSRLAEQKGVSVEALFFKGVFSGGGSLLVLCFAAAKWLWLWLWLWLWPWLWFVFWWSLGCCFLGVVAKQQCSRAVQYSVVGWVVRAVERRAVQCRAMQCRAVQCSAVQRDVEQCIGVVSR